MREQTSLPHEFIGVGRLWSPTTKTGNYDNSRAQIDTIIIHSMVGTLRGSTAHFQNPAVNASAHYGIDFEGHIVQWIPESATAYHSGQYAMNQRSIGIEHEDQGNNQIVRPEALYESSSRLLVDLSLAHNIPLDREHIKKHNEIVPTGCPGTLDIDRIIARAQALLNPVQTTPIIEEPLHDYQMKPTDFVNMVTEGTEYRSLFAALGLDVNLAKKVGSSSLVVAELNRRINNAINAISQASAGGTGPQPPNSSPDGLAPLQEPTSIWKKDVFHVLRDIFSPNRGGRTT